VSELTSGPGSEPVRPEDMRISDAERREVQTRLQQAHDIGQLDLGEFDDRVKAVWAARTRRDLARVTADLPEPAAEPGRRTVFSDTGGGVTMRILTIIWGSLAAVNVVTWGLLALTTGRFLYPWWVWVAVPPAIVLLVLYVAGIGRPQRDH
jgi:hypothetical protein